MGRELRVKEEVDLSLIKFGYVSYNKLRDYITGRRMYFNCRINTYEDLIICIGVFYRGFLCGGVVLTKMEQNEAMIQTWYSREDRGKIELLNYSVDIAKKLSFNCVYLPIQKKYLSQLLKDKWKPTAKCLKMELKDDDQVCT